MTIASPTSRVLMRWVFLRALGLVWLVAFLSLLVQIEGLAGSHGIAPAAERLEAIERVAGGARFLEAPSITWWIGAGDDTLVRLCGAGVLLSGLLIAGVAPGPVCLLLWAIYLSLVSVVSPFLGFQWDSLLLEVGLIAVVFAPWKLRAFGLVAERPPSFVAVLLLRLLLFKLILMSGVVKLASGDPTWRDLSALDYHYWTTCLPSWTGWIAGQAPGWAQRSSCALMFALELGVPFLFFGSRRARELAFVLQVALQLGIAATGNYGFFNPLTIVLALSLLDDQSIVRVFPASRRLWERQIAAGAGPARETDSAAGAEPARKADSVEADRESFRSGFVGPMRAHLAPLALALLVLPVSLFQATGRFVGYGHLPGPALALLQVSQPFRSANSYGLFANMTTFRHEIVVEGSDDGEHWIPYEFPWKPGDPARRPGFVQPHMPRLDWQMWFAALGHWRQNPWFMTFLQRIAEGTPEVLRLLETDPFHGRPPRYLRAVVWDYRFADPETWRSDGVWWVRERLGLYCPVVSSDQSSI